VREIVTEPQLSNRGINKAAPKFKTQNQSAKFLLFILSSLTSQKFKIKPETVSRIFATDLNLEEERSI